jgi:hypothetical protein
MTEAEWDIQLSYALCLTSFAAHSSFLPGNRDQIGTLVSYKLTCSSRRSAPALRISREISFPENIMIRGHSKDSVESSCRGPNLPFDFQDRLLKFSSLARLLSS